MVFTLYMGRRLKYEICGEGAGTRRGGGGAGYVCTEERVQSSEKVEQIGSRRKQLDGLDLR